jgi:hypothetical protein
VFILHKTLKILDSVAKKKDYTPRDLSGKRTHDIYRHINGTKQRTRTKKNDATTRSRDSREADAIDENGRIFFVLQKNRPTTKTKTDEKIQQQQQNDDDDDESIINGRRRRYSEDFFTRRRGRI